MHIARNTPTEFKRVAGVFMFSILIITVAITAMLAGCTASPEETRATSAALVQQETFLTQTRETATQQLAAAQAKGDTAAAAKAQKTIATVDAALPTVIQAQKVLTEATNPDGTINTEKAISGGVTAVSALVPPPYGVLLGIGGTLVAAVIGEIRRKQAVDAAKSIVNSVDALKLSDPQVAAVFKSQRKVLRGQLTKLGEKIVDKERLNV
jgi:hypothetical protein